MGSVCTGIYNDELFYSLAARHGVYVGCATGKQVQYDLFGSYSGSAVTDLPDRLEVFCQLLPQGSLVTPEKIIEQHSLLPLFRPFLDKRRVSSIEEKMRQVAKGGIHCEIGAMASSVRGIAWLRFCNCCVEEDRNHHGEAYWRRSHQCPGIRYCHKHHIPLTESHVRNSGRTNRQKFHPLEFNCASGKTLPVRTGAEPHDLWLAEMVHWLLTHTVPALGLECLRQRYLDLMDCKGMTTALGRVRQQELHCQFLDYFGAGYLSELGCCINLGNPDHWLATLGRKQRKAIHPLYHLLLMRFLHTTPGFILSNDFEIRKPFGAAPFPCLNPAASHYGRPVIAEVILTRNSTNGSPVGNFHCACGFSYSRTGPDRRESDRFKRSRILSMGAVWENELRRLSKDPTLSRRQMAKWLGVNINTVNAYLCRVSLGDDLCTKRPNEDGKDNERSRYRNKLREILQRHSGFSRKEIRSIAEAEYAWLYRYDREWLFLQLPNPVPRAGARRHRVDWLQRDEEAYERVRQVIQELLAPASKPCRITVGKVGEAAGILAWLQKHKDKLPRIHALLKTSLESVEDFQLRRVQWAVQELIAEGQALVEWRIIRKAGLRPGFSIKVAQEIQRVVLHSYRDIVSYGTLFSLSEGKSGEYKNGLNVSAGIHDRFA